MTFLHRSVGFGVNSIILAKLSVERLGVDVNARDNGLQTALHIACGFDCGHADVIDFLLSHDAEVNAKDSEGKTPLHHAVENFDTLKHKQSTISALLRAGADIKEEDNTSKTPLDYAQASDDNAELLVDLLNGKEPVTNEENAEAEFAFDLSDTTATEAGRATADDDFEW